MVSCEFRYEEPGKVISRRHCHGIPHTHHRVCLIAVWEEEGPVMAAS